MIENTIDKYRYTIDNNAISVWNIEHTWQPEPFLLQPERPDGTPWANEAEAQQWIESLLNGWIQSEKELIEQESITTEEE